MPAPSKDQLIELLQLEPHIEGGYFRRSYQSEQWCDGGERLSMSSIFYLLTGDSPIGYLHCNRSDIVHYWQGGGALRYTLLSPAGVLSEVVMGPDLLAGQQLQLTVAGGYWKASELLAADSDFGLISEAVSPGFDYRDMTLAQAGNIAKAFPQHWPQLNRLIRTAT